jgi:uncharacterized membrane protein
VFTRLLAVRSGRQQPSLVPRSDLGESPLWPAAALITTACLYATLPGRFIVGPSSGVFSVFRWGVPALTGILLAALLVIPPQTQLIEAVGQRAARARVTRRAVTLTMTAIISAASAVSIVVLVHLLVSGAKAQAPLLLKAAIHMWCTNVLLFALWFWQLDAGGPAQRLRQQGHARDFLFPQQAMPELAQAWQPTFIDYLYVSFTNATAFSPTDAMPLSRWAKVLMLLEAAASLLLALMVAARAVNILR